MKEHLPLFSDIDGVITCGQKIWNAHYEVVEGVYTPQAYERLSLSKMFSDKDSWVLNNYGALITLVSNDMRISKQRCKDNDWNFIYVPENKEKKDYICKESGMYYYVGDAMPDLQCLLHAKIGFIPSDASSLLKRKCEKLSNIVLLTVKSGEGVLDNVVSLLIEAQLWSEK